MQNSASSLAGLAQNDPSGGVSPVELDVEEPNETLPYPVDELPPLESSSPGALVPEVPDELDADVEPSLSLTDEGGSEKHPTTKSAGIKQAARMGRV